MIEELEKLRQKIISTFFKTIGIIIIIILFILFIFYEISIKGISNELPRGLLFKSISTSILAGTVLGYIISYFITNKDRKAFSDMYKKEIVLTSFNKICTNVSFNLDRGIPRNVIANTGMMRMGDIYSSNDYITGQYKNTNFEMSDVWLQEEYTDSDGHTHRYTIFKGQWYIFDFNKTFKANIQVCEKTFRNAKRKSLFVKEEEKLKKVELEDLEFNKIFKVYAQNEFDAFYVLTPNTIKKIKEVNNKISGHILLCFIDNKLHIGLYNNKDLFEPSIFVKVNLDKATKKTLDEISIITSFIDILSLDNDLFKI